MENNDSEKEELPIWCEKCNQQGFIYVDDPEKPAFVVCHRCGWEATQLWCPKCGMGGDYIRNLENRPASWVCPSCKTRYRLPDNYYEEPVPLYIDEDLPENIKVKVHSIQSQPFIKLTKKPFPGLIFLFFLIVSLAVAVFAKYWKLQLSGLLLFIIILVLATLYREYKEKAPKRK